MFCADCLIMVYICTKFHKNILNGFRVMERTRFVTDRQTDTVTELQTDKQTTMDVSLGGGEGGHNSMTPTLLIH